MTSFPDAIAAAEDSPARLRALLTAEMERGDRELRGKRTGYDEPITVVFADDAAVVPVPLDLRADPRAIGERAWLVVAATIEALRESRADGPLEAGAFGPFLALRMGEPDVHLAAWWFEDEAIRNIDRLRARGIPFPAGVIQASDWREPIGSHHPLKVAHAVASLGGSPVDPASVNEHEDAVLQMLGANGNDVPRPHDDPDPGRRIARRILQRLDGMGKWGGYHTEFTHLQRGFAPADKELANAVGEALIQAGLLSEKPSVGQRHVFLEPRRVREIRGLIERGEVPATLDLPPK